jgi:p-cumate 2,3-dioxygenase ferredoxin component
LTTDTMLRLCSTSDIPKGEPFKVEVEGYAPFCVYHAEGHYFVTEDICTHGEASLGEEGDLDGFVITCTWHMGQFDIRTGEAITTPCSVDLKTFPVTVADGDIFIAPHA